MQRRNYRYKPQYTNKAPSHHISISFRTKLHVYTYHAIRTTELLGPLASMFQEIAHTMGLTTASTHSLWEQTNWQDVAFIWMYDFHIAFMTVYRLLYMHLMDYTLTITIYFLILICISDNTLTFLADIHITLLDHVRLVLRDINLGSIVLYYI